MGFVDGDSVGEREKIAKNRAVNRKELCEVHCEKKKEGGTVGTGTAGCGHGVRGQGHGSGNLQCRGRVVTRGGVALAPVSVRLDIVSVFDNISTCPN